MELEALFPFVIPHVKACPDPTAIFHIRQALRDFCTRTLVWQANLAPMPTVVGFDSYMLAIPAGASLVKLLMAGIDDEPLGIVDRTKGVSGSSRNPYGRIWTEDRKAVHLFPVPSAAGKQIKVLAALKPTQAATEIEDQLFEDFASIIATGAKASLLNMVNVTWSDPRLALDLTNQFKADCARTASRVSKGFGRSARQVRPFTR